MENKRRVKRKLNSKPFILVSIISIALIFIFTLPPIINENNLKALGYDESAVDKIIEYKLDKEFLDQELYTESLNDALKLTDFDLKYLEIYKTTVLISEDEKLLFNRLIDKGYTDIQIADLLLNLEFYEITPLLVFDYQEDLEPYIVDVEANSITNSESKFDLTNEYRTLYENIEPVELLGQLDMNVSKQYILPQDYLPTNLVSLSTVYASSGVTMEEKAAEQFVLMLDAMQEAGLRAYANNAYRSYDTQTTLYDNYVIANGEDLANTFSAKPGHSEHQTGLAVDVASTNTTFSTFADTDEYLWLVQNAYKYGFIQRYANDKTDITGYSQEEWHWRYLGVDLAAKVYESKLTYDEYYELYLKPFTDKEVAEDDKNVESKDDSETE